MPDRTPSRSVFDLPASAVKALRDEFGAVVPEGDPATESPSVRTRGTPALPSPRPRWKKKRWWCFALLLLAGLIAGSVAWVRGQQTRLIIYNTSPEALPPVIIMAGGMKHTVPALDPDTSHRWVVEGAGEAGMVHLAASGDDAWVWDGAWLTPGSGQRMILRISGPGVVEVDESQSVWHAVAE